MRRKISDVVAVALGLFAFSAAAQPSTYVPPSIEELLPAMPPARFAPMTGMACTPKIELSELRLAWTDKGKSFVELTYDATKINEDFFAAYPNTPAEYDENRGLTEEQRGWVLSRVTEKIGDKRWLYGVDGGQLVQVEITGLDYVYDGLDGVVAFHGTLTTTGVPNPAAVYIAFPCDTMPRMSRHKSKALPQANRDAVLKWMAPDPDFTAAKLLEAHRLPFGGLVLATVRIDLSDVLFCLSPSRGRLWRVGFPGGETVGGLAVADRPGEHCYAMGDSTIYVLPDFNGDGYNELLVNSTFTYLYDISTYGSGALRELRCTQYAPTK